MQLPSVIEHREIAPTGSCNGVLVKKTPHFPSWDCNECSSSFSGEDLDYLSGDYIARTAYSEDEIYFLNQEAMRDMPIK